MFRDQTAGRRPREKTQEDKGAGQRKNGSGSIVVVLVVVVLERTKWGRTRGSVRSAGLLPCIPGVVLVRARTGVAPWFHLSFAASLPRSASTLSSLAQRCVVFIRVYLVLDTLASSISVTEYIVGRSIENLESLSSGSSRIEKENGVESRGR